MESHLHESHTLLKHLFVTVFMLKNNDVPATMNEIKTQILLVLCRRNETTMNIGADKIHGKIKYYSV